MAASTSQMNSVQPPQLIGSYPESAAKILSYEAQKLQQCDREECKLHKFTDEWQTQQERTDAFGRNSINAISHALTFWCGNSSNRCDTAMSLVIAS